MTTKPKSAIVEYEHVSTDTCPWCSEDFAAIRTTMQRTYDIETNEETEEWSHTVACRKGHRFDLVMRTNSVPHYRVRVPKQRPAGLRAPARTFLPCQGCGNPIQGGEAYYGGPDNPRHLGC